MFPSRPVRRRARLVLQALETRLAPASFIVSNTFDSGPGSLRQAVLDANALIAIDSIVFDPTVFANPQTITLTSGDLAISDPVIITGPAAKLTIDANQTAGIFYVDVPGGTADQTVTINGLTLTNSRGTAIYDYNVSLALANVTITECTDRYSGNGGAVAVGSKAGSLTIADSVFSGNTTGGGGGAIYAGGISLTLTRCTFSSNKSGLGGGAIRFSPNSSTGGVFTMSDCTVVNNNDNSSQNGGGLFLSAGTATIHNSTIWGNCARSGGAIQTSSNLIIDNSTIAQNVAIWYGGGVSTAGTISMTSTIVADNVAPFFPDVNGTINATKSLFGNTAGATISGSNNLFNLNPRLQPLADNGGPTLTSALGLGSPCIDAGGNPANLVNDQRGPGFPRVVGFRPDIGAAEGPAAHPSAAMDSFIVTAGGPTSQTIKLTYFDDTAIDVGTLGTGDITITGPNGFIAVPTFVSVDNDSNGSPRTATYQFTPPGGSWDASDYGVCTVIVNANEVFDTTSAPDAVTPGAIATIAARVAGNYVVDLVVDERDSNSSPGDLSLREALSLTWARFGTPDTITFDPIVFGSATTMTLTLGQLFVSDATTIIGPDAKLTIDAKQADRLFSIAVAGPSGQPVSLSKLTLVNGKSSNGGAGISIGNAALSLSQVQIKNCQMTSSNYDGGAIAVPTSLGSLNMFDSTITANTMTSTAPWNGGGGIGAAANATITITRCLISNNSSSGGKGGGIFLRKNASLTITDSTITGNTASSKGGGICLYEGGSLAIINSTIASNSSAVSGGGICLLNGGSLAIAGSTIMGNTSGDNGGGVCLLNGGSTTITNNTIYGNTAATTSSSFNSGNGGAVYANAGTATFLNTTVSQNSGKIGAGLYLISGSATLQNTSVVFNNGSGVAGGQTLTLISSLVAKNTGADIGGKVTANFSLIGNAAFATITGSNNKLNVDPMLRPLADNGGATKTHALLAGSPAINAGYNPSSLTSDPRGFGYLRTFGTQTDIGAFEVQAPPQVTNVIINGGAAQRSRVTSLQVSFNSRMTLPTNPADTFRLVRQSDNAQVALAATVDNTGPTTAVSLAFVGGPVEFGSLADGRYSLTVLAVQAFDPSTQLLDGNGDDTPGDNYVLIGNPTNKLFRLFGDADGNGKVEQSDFSAFRAAINTNSVAFDFDGSGQVNLADLFQFRNRFNLTI